MSSICRIVKQGLGITLLVTSFAHGQSVTKNVGKDCTLLQMAIDQCGGPREISDDAPPSEPDYPQNIKYVDTVMSVKNASTVGKNFIEIRARQPVRDGPDTSLTGHVFIMLGSELTDGTRIYYGGWGFYPRKGESSESLPWYRSIYANGQVTYQMPDITADVYYRGYITEYQQNLVEHIVGAWDNKDYSLWKDNCVALVKYVSEAIGLDTGDAYSHWPSGLSFPVTVAKTIAERNTSQTPLEFVRKDLERQVRVKNEAIQDYRSVFPAGYIQPRHEPGLPGAATGPDLPPALGGHGEVRSGGGGGKGGGYGGANNGTSKGNGEGEGSDLYDKFICTVGRTICS